MKLLRALAVAVVPLLFTACPTPTAQCTPATCPVGCCDSSGQCLNGMSEAACGTNGALCSTCFTGQSCQFGLCVQGSGGGAGGGGGGGGAGGGGTGPITCAGGLSACSGACLDLATDRFNCGECGKACGGTQACQGAVCVALPTDCTAAPCPQGFYCEAGSKQCRAGCNAATDCPQPGTCETQTHTCSCNTGFHRCGTQCVADTSTSACGLACANCGGIANAQPACTGGFCDFTCDNGFHRCGNECRSSADVNSCGTSCTPCQPPANGTSTCTGSACDFFCNAGYHRCGSQCLPNTSVSSCGSLCTPCAPPANGTATCNGTSCDFTCTAGFHRCGSQCLPNNSTSSCGTLCTPCTPPASSTPTCNGVSCGFTCNSGTHACGGQCLSNYDVGSCGASCTPCVPPSNASSTCNGTSCDFSCSFGFHRCGSSCALDSSPFTCGTSCTACPLGPANSTATCNGVSCGWVCNSGFHDCGGQCVSDSSTTQCGSSCLSCTPPANASSVCQGGACDFVCNAGYHRCGTSCRANTDVDACGTTSCTPCPAGPPNSTRTCNGTACGYACNAGFNACGGQCVANDFNAACGTSCTACTASTALERPTCDAGVCGTDCVTACNLTCVDVRTNPAHCGGCNAPCGGGQVCSGGECRAGCATGVAFRNALPAINTAAAYGHAVADFNGDGRLDVASGGTPSSGFGVTVRFGNGDGTFGAPATVTTSSIPSGVRAIRAADLNADNRPDLIVTFGGTTFGVLMNNGSGGFAAPTYFTGSYSISTVTVGDVSGDGRPDLLATYNTTSTAFSFGMINNGAAAGTPFSGTVSVYYGVYSISDAARADFNKDGRVDVVIATGTTTWRYLPATATSPYIGTGTSTALPVGDSFRGLAAADVNSDTNPDLLVGVSSSGGAGVRVYLGNGNGTFQAPTFVPFNAPYALGAVDLNGDAFLDLYGGSTGLLGVKLATAAGAWGAEALRSQYPTAVVVNYVEPGDLTGDSRPELVAGARGYPNFAIANSGTGVFPAPPATGGAPTLQNAAAGDLDGDGDLDLFVAPDVTTGSFGTAEVMTGNASGTFTRGQSMTVYGFDSAIGHLNADSYGDVVTLTASVTAPAVVVRTSSATATLSSGLSLAASGNPARVAIADLDGDGLNDVLAATTAGLDWFRNQGAAVFAARQTFAFGNLSSVLVTDLNLDGRADVVVGYSSGGTYALRTYLNLGGGALVTAPTASVSLGSSAWDLKAGDFNGDGRPDVAAGLSSEVRVYTGGGNGSLTFVSSVATTPSNRFEAADFDNDGREDLLTFGPDGARVFRNTGGASFAAYLLFQSGRNVAADGAVGKVDGDTFRDVVLLWTNAAGSEVTTLLGYCR